MLFMRGVVGIFGAENVFIISKAGNNRFQESLREFEKMKWSDLTGVKKEQRWERSTAAALATLRCIRVARTSTSGVAALGGFCNGRVTWAGDTTASSEVPFVRLPHLSSVHGTQNLEKAMHKSANSSSVPVQVSSWVTQARALAFL